jgi:signal transduction histidine kinase
MEMSFISANVIDLMGADPSEIVGRRAIWDERIAPQDLELFRQKIEELKKLGSVSFMHRLIDRNGMPVWVSHSLRSVTAEQEGLFRGCIVELGNNLHVQELWQSAVDRFIHKIGNHFQILVLVINSLNKVLPTSRETHVLQNTVDGLMELARVFAEYNQVPTSWTRVDITQILRSVLMRWQPFFIEKGVTLEENIDASVETVALFGDPFLLELAVSHIVQNAMEATDKGRKATLYAKPVLVGRACPVVKVGVRDSGAGIEAKNLGQVLTPFFTTKEGHAGLGLSVASRFVEMHSGHIRLSSEDGKGTEVEIEIPVSSVGMTGITPPD